MGIKVMVIFTFQIRNLMVIHAGGTKFLSIFRLEEYFNKSSYCFKKVYCEKSAWWERLALLLSFVTADNPSYLTFHSRVIDTMYGNHGVIIYGAVICT